MNKVTFFIARPGFGKSTLATLYSQRTKRGFVFHMGVFLKNPDAFADYITAEEIIYIKKIKDKINDSITKGSLCSFDRVDSIAIKVIIKLSKEYNVFLDGYPRNIIQARMLYTSCADNSIMLNGVNIEYDVSDELQDMLSFHRQFERDLRDKTKEPLDMIERYKGKIETFNNETLPALHYLQSERISITTLYIGYNGNIHMSKMFSFEHIVDRKTHNSFFGNEFFFYPANVNDYATLYCKYVFDKFPVMVTMTLINKCTDNCEGCFNASYNTNEYIDIDILEKLIDELADNGTVAIKVAGREPTTYPYLDRFLKKCKERHLLCVMITSGANLDHWERALYENCDHLRVSLNAFTEESHKKFHRPTDKAIGFKERLHILKRMTFERKQRGLTTGVSFLLRDDNANELPMLIDFCKDIGVDYVRFSKLNYFRQGQDKNSKFIQEMEERSTNSFIVKYHEQFYAECTDINSSIFACPALLSRSVILANGDVVSCHCSRQLANNEYDSIYGNINSSSFGNIWRGEKRSSFIKRISDEMVNNYKHSGEYVCNGTNCCATCKYSGFNHINRWIANQGVNVVEGYWEGILSEM